jgi:hypothetical protein
MRTVKVILETKVVLYLFIIIKGKRRSGGSLPALQRRPHRVHEEYSRVGKTGGGPLW